jgi:hypothetical protein
MRLVSAILLCFMLCAAPPVALASPPPPILPGSLKALEICRYVGSYGLAQTNSGDNGIFYSSDNSDLPAELANLAGEAFIFRVCVDMDNNTHYFVRIPGSSHLPACEIFEQEIFRDPSGKVGLPTVYGTTDLNDGVVRVSGWTDRVPEVWQQWGYPAGNEPAVLAQAKNGPCLPGNDPAYVHITNVAPGLFKAMTRVFQEAAASDQGFAKNFSGLAKGRLNTSSALRGGKIWSVSCTNTNCDAFLSNGDSVFFDVGDKGVVITQVLPRVD